MNRAFSKFSVKSLIIYSLFFISLATVESVKSLNKVTTFLAEKNLFGHKHLAGFIVNPAQLMPNIFLDKKQKLLELKLKQDHQNFQLITDCGADGILINPENIDKNEPNNKKMIVFLQGRGQAWQCGKHIRDVAGLVRESGCQVLVLNYPGIGRCKGWSKSLDELTEKVGEQIDSVALKNGISKNNIFLIGTSLGGYVALNLVKVKNFQNVFSDRSFGSFVDVAKGRVGTSSSLFKKYIIFEGFEIDGLNIYKNIPNKVHSYAVNDPIIPNDKSLHYQLDVGQFKENYNCHERGHCLIFKDPSNHENAKFKNVHEMPADFLICQDCKKTLLEIESQWVKSSSNQ